MFHHVSIHPFGSQVINFDQVVSIEPETNNAPNPETFKITAGWLVLTTGEKIKITGECVYELQKKFGF